VSRSRHTCLAVLATGALLFGTATPALATDGHGKGGGKTAEQEQGRAKPAGPGKATGHGKPTGPGKATGHGKPTGPGKATGHGKPAPAPRAAAPSPSRTAGSPARGGRAAGDPRGNNGTVKIDGAPYGSHPDNESHVACEFEIEFFGFDAGQRADLTLTAHAPTRGGVVWQRDGVLISDDAAGGAGRDVDATVGPITAADLALEGIAPARQGYHLKLTVDVLGAPGAGKHKVFWLEPCAAPAPASGTAPAAAPAVPGVTPAPAVASGAAAPAVLGQVVTRDQAGDQAPAAVLGARADRGGLPVTGAALAGLLATGLALLLGGIALYVAARRRRTS
jgi:hypothetical protein